MLDGYKTYIAAIAAVLIAVGYALESWIAGEPININVLVNALIALALVFLRKGITAEIKKATD